MGEEEGTAEVMGLESTAAMANVKARGYDEASEETGIEYGVIGRIELQLRGGLWDGGFGVAGMKR
jgi:hypothetical protein